MADKKACVAAGCPDDVCEKLTAKGLDFGKILALASLIGKYIDKIKADPKEIWNLLVEAFQIWNPPAPQPAPTPAPVPQPAP